METRMGIQAKVYQKKVLPNLIEPQIKPDRLFDTPTFTMEMKGALPCE